MHRTQNRRNFMHCFRIERLLMTTSDGYNVPFLSPIFSSFNDQYIHCQIVDNEFNTIIIESDSVIDKS